MSKAEDLSRQYVMPFLDKQYEKYGEHKQMELSRFDGYDMMSAYEEGYQQAEKDMELSWEDIGIIISIDQQVCGVMGISDYIDNHQQAMEEVLKRFKERKENKYGKSY